MIQSVLGYFGYRKVEPLPQGDYKRVSFLLPAPDYRLLNRLLMRTRCGCYGELVSISIRLASKVLDARLHGDSYTIQWDGVKITVSSSGDTKPHRLEILVQGE